MKLYQVESEEPSLEETLRRLVEESGGKGKEIKSRLGEKTRSSTRVRNATERNARVAYISGEELVFVWFSES